MLMLQSEEVTSDHRRVTPSMPGSTVSNYDLSPSPAELCVISQSQGKIESLCPLSRASPPALHTIALHKSPADSGCSARPDERPSSTHAKLQPLCMVHRAGTEPGLAKPSTCFPQGARWRHFGFKPQRQGYSKSMGQAGSDVHI